MSTSPSGEAKTKAKPKRARASSFVVRVGERSHAVQIFADGRVSVDGHEAHWGQSGDGRTLVRDAQGLQEVIVLAPGIRPTEAAIGGERVLIGVQTAAEAALDDALGTGVGGPSDGKINAPMPGRIVKFMAEVGDEVEGGSPIIIIEAMKMENELIAPADGRVESITVEAGQAVEAGALLMTLKLPENDQD